MIEETKSYEKIYRIIKIFLDFFVFFLCTYVATKLVPLVVLFAFVKQIFLVKISQKINLFPAFFMLNAINIIVLAGFIYFIVSIHLTWKNVKSDFYITRDYMLKYYDHYSVENEEEYLELRVDLTQSEYIITDEFGDVIKGIEDPQVIQAINNINDILVDEFSQTEIIVKKSQLCTRTAGYDFYMVYSRDESMPEDFISYVFEVGNDCYIMMHKNVVLDFIF